MGARRWSAAAAIGLSVVGCRQVDGIDGYRYDLPSADGGGGSGSSLPGGWSGPIAVYEGSPGTSPACPEAYPSPILRGGTGLVGAPATCAACTCGAPPVSCTPGAVVTHNHATCSGAGTPLSPAAGQCTPFVPGGNGVKVSPPTTNVGACAPAGGEASLPPLVWTTEAVACGLAAGAPCPADASCAAPPAPFEAETCIYTYGKSTCPALYPRERAWSTATDSRACTACACGAPTAPGCSVTTTVYTDTACSTGPSVIAVGQCAVPSGVQSLLATVLSATAACAPGGGAPSGMVVSATPVTICCTP